jgi:endonuclease G
VFDNAEQNKPLSTYALTVDEVEKITGINFFSKFPKHIERSAEAMFDIKQWKGLN